MSHIQSLAKQIESPIIALGNFIDNAVQSFYSQVVEGTTARKGEPLLVDFTID